MFYTIPACKVMHKLQILLLRLKLFYVKNMFYLIEKDMNNDSLIHEMIIPKCSLLSNVYL